MDQGAFMHSLRVEKVAAAKAWVGGVGSGHQRGGREHKKKGGDPRDPCLPEKKEKYMKHKKNKNTTQQ